MKLTKRQRTVLKAAWLCCPDCGKSWLGPSFRRMYAAQIRKCEPDISKDELNRKTKAVMKQQGYWRKYQAAIAEDTDGLFHCPHCGKTYTYSEIVQLTRKHWLSRIIAKTFVFLYNAGHNE